MGNKYYITGSQLAVLTSADEELKSETLDEIMDNQYLGESEQ